MISFWTMFANGPYISGTSNNIMDMECKQTSDKLYKGACATHLYMYAKRFTYQRLSTRFSNSGKQTGDNTP